MACLRLKRHLNVDSSDAIIISFKRPKICNDDLTSDDEIKKVLKFAGTVKTKDECIDEHLTKIGGKNIAPSQDTSSHRNFLKHRSVNVKAKVLRDHQLTSKANRYKIVSCARGIPDSADSAEVEGAESSDGVSGSCRVYDVEPDVSESSTAHSDAALVGPGVNSPFQATSFTEDVKSADDSNYVYDLYYLKDLAGLDLTQHLIDIQQYPSSTENLVHSTSVDDDSDRDPDDDDSNDEDNWRNDYPDEDENYEKDFAYGDDNFCDGDEMEHVLSSFGIDDDEEEVDESEDEDSSPPKNLKAKSLRTRMMEQASKDCIFTSAKSGNRLNEV